MVRDGMCFVICDAHVFSDELVSKIKNDSQFFNYFGIYKNLNKERNDMTFKSFKT